ncbi:hypothetical protein AVEN_196235-2-1, partial [Araneus ventricosus]
ILPFCLFRYSILRHDRISSRL